MLDLEVRSNRKNQNNIMYAIKFDIHNVVQSTDNATGEKPVAASVLC